LAADPQPGKPLKHFLEGIMSRKNTFEFASKLITLAALCAGLTGCGSVPTISTSTSAPSPATTMLPTKTAPPATATLPPLPTLALLLPSPTTTITLPPSPTPTPTQTLLPLPDVLPKFPLDGYVMLFAKDGDLYFQDGENVPVKLTHINKPSHESYFSPKLSDDNQKVVFIRNDNIIYSINTDGTQEQTVVSNDKLDSFGSEMNIGALSFVPHTHQVFFLVFQCKEQDSSYCPASAFLANADSGETKKLAYLGSFFADRYELRNIKISPDGKMLAIGAPDGMDIFTLDGNLIRDNVLPYEPNKYGDYPSLFWLPDSSGLIVALPNTSYGDHPAYTFWRYTIINNTANQVPLDPSPMTLVVVDKFQVSPDGNWILYGGNSNYDISLYLGNLTDGHTQVIGSLVYPGFLWSPDSKHFLYGNFISAIDKSPIRINGHYLSWLNANHYVYIVTVENKSKTYIGEINGSTILSYELEHCLLIRQKH
jgi:Tol biopolymer transport system component